MIKTMIETYGYSRAGFLGNPSDGYFGKTIAFAMANFRARVLLYPSARLEIRPSKADMPVFENLPLLPLGESNLSVECKMDSRG